MKTADFCMNVSPEALMAQIAAGTPPAIVDVRSRQEFAQGHIPGAIHVPFWQVAAGSPTLDPLRERPIVVYCGHGPRAYIAGSALRRRGFRHVAYLTGHMKKWRSMNLRLEVD
jgi:rhodanese-related sulfurtransferase